MFFPVRVVAPFCRCLLFRVDLRDRSDGRRHMITVHRAEQGLVAMLKGAPDEVLAMCSRVDRDDTVAQNLRGPRKC